MQALNPLQDMTPSQLGLFQQNRRDLGAATVDTDMSNYGCNNAYFEETFVAW